MAASSHCENMFKNMKVVYSFEMVRNVIESDFVASKMAIKSDGHFGCHKITFDHISPFQTNTQLSCF